MGKKRILFVDDEQRVLEGLEDLLLNKSRKWEMSFVLDGPAALREIQKRDFDVVVTDMRMPVMDGATLLRELQHRHPGVVRIVLSGHAELEAAMRAVPVAHQFVAKPCRADELENIIERACDLNSLINDGRVRDVVGRLQRLPSSPRVYGALTRMLADERTGARDVARVLSRDIAMSAKILQLVNSSFLGVGRRVTNVENAVTYLGMQMVKNLVLSVEVFDVARQPSLRGFAIDALQRDALLVAGCARALCGKDRRMGEDAFMAGLLHDIGKLVLALELPHAFGDALRRSREERIPLVEAEFDEYGLTHAEVGAYLLGLWGLPYPIVEAVAHHHQPRAVAQRGFDALAAVYIAAELIDEIQPERTGVASLRGPLDEAYVEALGVKDRLDEWREMVKSQIQAQAAEERALGESWRIA
jgi:HD-like signal output (HDOD) protein/ActR/RegA family two-component response regulator